VPIRWVLVRDPLGQCEPQALLATDLDSDPAQIVAWFVLRWQLEVTRQEARRHLGVATQRQWSALAIRRTTPALLGRFALVTLLAHERFRHGGGAMRPAAWYAKEQATFADALALVRAERWAHLTCCWSSRDADMVNVPRAIVERLTDTLCYAA
jgi:hypothetical protein